MGCHCTRQQWLAHGPAIAYLATPQRGSRPFVLLLAAPCPTVPPLRPDPAACATLLSQSVEDLLKELTAAELPGNPFSLFARRATLVITGLVHISILLLPKSAQDPEGATASAATHGPANGSTSSGGAGSSKAGGGAGGHCGAGSSSSVAGGAGGDPAAELRAAGFPADSSDIRRWEQVQGILDRTSAGGLDCGGGWASLNSRG